MHKISFCGQNKSILYSNKSDRIFVFLLFVYLDAPINTSDLFVRFKSSFSMSVFKQFLGLSRYTIYIAQFFCLYLISISCLL